MNFELQFLKAGAALCGKVFPNFVTTWNWLVNAVSNLKGDADVDDAQGHIKVDFEDPNHPIIRCSGCNGNGGGGSGEEETDCVTSVNSADGALSVIGGKGIEVSTDGQTIKVTWNEGKEDEDEDPNAETNTPDSHDPNGDSGSDSSDNGGGGGVPDCGDAGGVAFGIAGDSVPGESSSGYNEGVKGSDGGGHSGNDACDC